MNAYTVVSNYFEVLFLVLDHLSADVHGHVIDRASERGWWLVFVPDGRAGVGATHKACGNTDRDRHGEGNVALPNEVVIDVELAAAWYGDPTRLRLQLLCEPYQSASLLQLSDLPRQ